MTAAASVFARWRLAGAPSNWMGWRLRALVVTALLGCVGLFAVFRAVVQSPYLDIVLRPSASAAVAWVAPTSPASNLAPTAILRSIETDDGQRIEIDATLLLRSPRWVAADDDRLRHHAQQVALAGLVQRPTMNLVMLDGTRTPVRPVVRGLDGLGAMFWLMSGLALVLYLIGAVVLLSRPGLKNLLYAAMSGSQSLNLLLIGTESLAGHGLPGFVANLGPGLHTLLDLCTGAAALHACLIHPHAVRLAPWLALLGWSFGAGFVVYTSMYALPGLWWWTQSLLVGYGVLTVAILTWSHRREPHPATLVFRRLSVAASGTLLLLTLAVALADRHAQAQQAIASIGPVIWYVFFASLLLLMPFMSRAQHVMREFVMLAGLSTVATSLDLLFITVFALDQFASMSLALFVAIGLYAALRQWILGHFSGPGAASAEKTFDCLYRAARAVEASPQQTREHVARLLIELFDPLETGTTLRGTGESAIAANGAMLVVPLPRLFDGTPDDDSALFMRHAGRGRRLFTVDDAHLVDRVLAQLRSAVAFDRAVEQGRSEERMRLAQDLHDDIGARLLTLIYKAPDPEMEEYLRHTLQDLKTLTRGLAARDHLLSEAAVEWKSDIAQRLAASHCDLHWGFQADRDLRLGVVHWSGLTRILRELVNNVIAHAEATHVDIMASCVKGELTLRVSDDGIGRAPQGWSHGLGLGGVRKRVKQLGGQVRWLERQPQGIVCELRVPLLGAPPP